MYSKLLFITYVTAVRAAGTDPYAIDPDPETGLGSPDNPAFAGMHTASARIVGASVEAARSVWRGEYLHAGNIAGGLHHAMPESAAGFCIYNDPAIAIQWLLDAGCGKVAYVDNDVHHGDGVQRIFYHDPRVLTISLHETPRTLFPGISGFPTEIGGPGAEGTAVNVALPAATTDEEWLRAWHAVVPPLVHAFEPAVLVSQHGCDSHTLDPLAHLTLSVDGQRAAASATHELAHQVCEGRWVVTGGGGYALAEVVPRTWTHLLAIMAGAPLEPATPTPPEWRAAAERICVPPAPSSMSDGRPGTYTEWSRGYDPADQVDQAVLATRRAVFPANGLMLDA